MNVADLNLFRRMRGLFWVVLVGMVVLAPGLVVAGVTIPIEFGAYTDSFARDVGDTMNVVGLGFGVLAVLGYLATVLYGATAGSVDLQRGVMRDLVLTGKPRWRIALGRILAAGTWILVAYVVSVAVVVLLAVLFAPSSGPMEWESLGREFAGSLSSMGLALGFTAGIALLLGSRGPAIGAYFVLIFILDGILSAIPWIGERWQHVSIGGADGQVAAWIGADVPFGQSETGNSNTVALLVVLGWALIPIAFGMVRLSRRDL